MRNFNNYCWYLVFVRTIPKFPPATATKQNSLDTVINTTLLPGQSITSPSGKISLTMQSDGNLVLTMDKKIVASSNTSTKGGVKAVLRSDATLAVLNSAENVVFSTDKPSFYLYSSLASRPLFNFNPQYLLQINDDNKSDWVIKLENNQNEYARMILPKV